jgi:osmotically-inducible protein OsmY
VYGSFAGTSIASKPVEVLRNMSLKAIAGSLGVSALLCAAAWSQQSAQPQQTNQPIATGVPADAKPKSASTKPNAGMDRDTTRKIEDSLSKDQALAGPAHNVKVSSRNGRVTLRGTVASEDDKKNIEQKVEEVAGAGNVTDHMTVKAAKHQK